MNTPSNQRPITVTVAAALVGVQIVISLAASIIAAYAPADYKTYAATTPAILLVLYAVTAYYLYRGHPWARTVALLVSILGIIGNLSVTLYYDHQATVLANIIGLIIAVLIVGLLMAPASVRYFHRAPVSQ